MVEYVKKLNENVEDLGDKFDKVLGFLERLEGNFVTECDVECRAKLDGTDVGVGAEVDEESGEKYEALCGAVGDGVAASALGDSEEDGERDSVADEKHSTVSNNLTPTGIQGDPELSKESDLSVQTPVKKGVEEKRAFVIRSALRCDSPGLLDRVSRALTRGEDQSQDSSTGTTPTGKGKTNAAANGFGY